MYKNKNNNKNKNKNTFILEKEMQYNHHLYKACNI